MSALPSTEIADQWFSDIAVEAYIVVADKEWLSSQVTCFCCQHLAMLRKRTAILRPAVSSSCVNSVSEYINQSSCRIVAQRPCSGVEEAAMPLPDFKHAKRISRFVADHATLVSRETS